MTAIDGYWTPADGPLTVDLADKLLEPGSTAVVTPERTQAIRALLLDLSPNARWLTLAHNLCTDAGVPSGHIADRLEGLRAALPATQKQSVDVTRIGFGTYEVRMNCVTDTAINGLGGGFPARLKAGDTFVCKLGADFTVDGKPMPIRDVLVAWANYMGKQLVFTGEHDTGEFTP